MKITGVELFPLYYPLKQPYGDANGYKKYRAIFLFRITTQSGITGWGECSDWLPTLKLLFEGKITPYLIGKQATSRQLLVQHIKKWHVRAAAGVSMALTEIQAKAHGISVCDLWGGRWRDNVPVYASFQSYTEQPGWMDHSIQLVSQAVQRGFKQVKVKIGAKTFAEDQMHIIKMQQTLSGESQIILDANQSYDLSAVRKWERSFSKWTNLSWFEEPMPLSQVSDYKLLRSNLSVPIAGGEDLKSAVEFLPLLQQGALDFIQPDPAHMGGVDAFTHTLKLSRDFGVRASPHTFDGALSRLYALFAQACQPPWGKMSQDDIEPVEWDEMDNPFTRIVPITPTAGTVTIPDGAGIGVELNEQLIKAHIWDGTVY